MAIQIKGIDHIVLLVSDVKRAVAFYCDVWGAQGTVNGQILG